MSYDFTDPTLDRLARLAAEEAVLSARLDVVVAERQELATAYALAGVDQAERDERAGWVHAACQAGRSSPK